MVPKGDEITSERTNFASQQQTTADATIQQDSHSSSAEQTKPASMSVIRESLQCKGIPQHTLSIIMASWRESTKKQYGTYLQKWQGFCSRRSVDPLSPSVNQVLEFLTNFMTVTVVTVH